jgi:hypothetical protein
LVRGQRVLQGRVGDDIGDARAEREKRDGCVYRIGGRRRKRRKRKNSGWKAKRTQQSYYVAEVGRG